MHTTINKAIVRIKYCKHACKFFNTIKQITLLFCFPLAMFMMPLYASLYTNACFFFDRTIKSNKCVLIHFNQVYNSLVYYVNMHVCSFIEQTNWLFCFTLVMFMIAFAHKLYVNMHVCNP